MSEPQRNEWFVRIWLINYQYEIILSSSYFRLKVLQTRDHTNYENGLLQKPLLYLSIYFFIYGDVLL
jgi:hypothetical protein